MDWTRGQWVGPRVEVEEFPFNRAPGLGGTGISHAVLRLLASQ